MSKKDNWLPTEENIKNYNLLVEMLEAQKREFSPLCSKKPNDNLNLMKIRMVNRVIEPLKKILEYEDSYDFLDILKEDDIASYSDVVLIISQYETAIKKFKDKYYLEDKFRSTHYSKEFRWMTQEFPPNYYDK